MYTVCPRSGGPFYIVSCYIKWVTTSWADGIIAIAICLLRVYENEDKYNLYFIV